MKGADPALAADSERNAVGATPGAPTLEKLEAVVPGDEGNRGRHHQSERTYLAVPFAEKDQAKALGAIWDRRVQSWYVPPGADIASLTRWSQQRPPEAAEGHGLKWAAPRTASEQRASEGRQYLSVPYGERAPAKAAGATWDKAAKCWYARSKADMGKLQRWLPKIDSHSWEEPALNPREEFGEALRSLGCQVAGEHPIMDGQRHRITTEGDKKGEQAGFYVGHLDGHPAGYIKNNRTGLDMKWKSKGCVLDPDQKAALAAAAAETLQARAANQKRMHAQTATRVARQGAELVQVIQPTPYMVTKGLGLLPGALTDHGGATTYIAAIDVDGKQWTTQYILEDGTKRFAKDSRKEGCFHVIGGLEALAAAPVILIAEGYATAATVSIALSLPTVAAFDSGNLPPVAKALHQKFPGKPIVIAGDDDRQVEATQGINPGKVKAEEAARAVGGVALLPIFAPGEQAADLKRFTDFNDLAQQSVLGEEAVVRQVGAAVDRAIRSQRELTPSPPLGGTQSPALDAGRAIGRCCREPVR